MVMIALLAFLLITPAHAEVTRSKAARAAFVKMNPCPAPVLDKCPGYVVDHMIPLCAGGRDDPSNMQWQTIAAGKAKDKEELALCRKLRACKK